MDHYPAAEPADLTLQLPRDMYYHLIHTLCAALPPPVPDTPENRVCRDNAIMAQIASLLPANADEANLAAQYVAANAQAMECIRRAQVHEADASLAMKWVALSTGMMRQAHSARRLLERVQAARQKREANAAATDQAAWIEHCALGLMADALGRVPAASVAEAPPPAPPAREAPEPDDKFRKLTEAEQYAVIYPRRAALIRSLGGLPGKPDFDPIPPALVHAIVTGDSPTLRALDVPAEA